MSDDGGGDAEAIEEGGEAGERGEYTETTETEGLGDRLQSACAGICIGLLLFFGAFPLLFWNEDRAVERYDALNEAEAQVQSVSGLDIDPANDGELLHFTVNITNGGNTLVDPLFGIESNGLQLKRDAEMYQWVEKKETKSKKNAGGKKTTTTTYKYSKDWRGYLIDSSQFKTQNGHNNPREMEFGFEYISANPIMIGAYELPGELVGKITWTQTLDVSVSDIKDEAIRNRTTEVGDYFHYAGNESSTVSTPQIGDQRVSFSETPESIITIVGVQNGNTLGAFVSETGEGGDVLLFKRGKYSSVEMFDEAEAENAFMTWILRFVGFFIMAFGLYLVFRPIEVFADIIPCVGSIIGCGLIFMSVFIAAILSSITIALAWLVAHPQIGGIVLVVMLSIVGCCAFGVKKLGGKMGGGNDNDSSSSSHGEKVVAGGADIAPTVYASAEPDVKVQEPPTVYASAPAQVFSIGANGAAQPVASSAPPGPYVPAAPYVPNA